MLDDDDRLTELAIRDNRCAVELDDVGADPVSDFGERAAGSANLVRAGGGPVERKSRLDQLQAVRLAPLLGIRRRADDGEHGFDVPFAQLTGELEAVGPHAANGVGHQQQAHRITHSAAPVSTAST